ncbi:sugar phosphate isomerase/epimerase [Nocardia sp. NRRL S-836]|uniref:sugar phosphate isomerase/epimerase family protein n=1 Tax=Nocardia sp. NRRL S-836 TaxID=1519492 RepID=UPI0006B02D9D|nr:sugar phosphate isomerase/epimerase family protein [Nocardia sp. NRRL S-836]
MTRIGLVDWRLPVTGPDAVSLAARLGVDGIQLDLGGPCRAPALDAPERLRSVRKAFSRTGIAPLAVSVNTLNDIGITVADAAAEVRQVITRALHAAVELGAGLVFLPSFRRSAITGPRQLARTAEVLRWACAEAERRGLLLASENVLQPSELRLLIEQVGSSAFRIVLDTGNPAKAGLDPVEVIRAAGDTLADQVHLKNPDDRLPLSVNAPAVLGAIRELEHTDVFVLENDHRDGDLRRLGADLEWVRLALN